jgi:hypothetical protein
MTEKTENGNDNESHEYRFKCNFFNDLFFRIATINKNTGVLPIGFRMATKPINTVVKNNVRSCIVFIVY